MIPYKKLQKKSKDVLDFVMQPTGKYASVWSCQVEASYGWYQLSQHESFLDFDL